MLNNQKILITGGTGHLGNTLIKQLNKLNIAPSVIILKNDYAYPLKNDQYTRITGDITDRDFIFDIVKQFDIVIHLASQISIKAKDDYMKLYKVNVIGTVNKFEIKNTKESNKLYLNYCFAESTASVEIVEIEE